MFAMNGKRLIVILLSIVMGGCSSIRARDATPAAEWKVYPGVRQDVKELGEIVTGQREDPAWVEAMVAVMLLADLPVSTVFDTLVSPYDLYRVYRSGQQAQGKD
ncbi:MAG TPA: YceK/YidQ family lipoprotein [Methylothermaceae bacterium]|nr:YceK/YidQ family lipoprotein [Methylothermaceae bacterium]